MSYLKQRNKAYSGQEYFLCDFNGDKWLTNTYIAELDTTEPRNTKDCKPRYLSEGLMPKLGQIVDVTKHTLHLTAGGPINETTSELIGPDLTAHVQTRYIEYFLARYPKAIFKTSPEVRYSPISIYNGNKLTGMIMPLKK